MEAEAIFETTTSAPVRAFIVLVRDEIPYSQDLGRRYIIPERGLLIGNSSQSDVYLEKIPEENCCVQLIFRNNYWHVQDLQGQSGVMVNGVLAHKRIISDGDLVMFGRTVFEFCTGTGVKVEFFEQNEKLRIDDSLTHALNKGAWTQFVEQDLRRYQQFQEERRTLQIRENAPPMAMMVLDIDHFKKFNDEHDHLVGDQVLRGVVARIKERVRTTDLVGRFGGEEFVVYLPHTGLSQALELAEEIRARIADDPFEINPEKHLSVTVSIGVAEFEPGMTLNIFLKEADDHLFKAKGAGRNRVSG